MIMRRLKIVVAAFGALSVAVYPALAQTWTQTSAPIADWTSVASSSDGSNLVAVAWGSDGFIFTSTNAGATWTQTSTPSEYWLCVASSSDGTKLAAGTGGGGVYTSTNSGATWTLTSEPDAYCSRLVSSADGSKLVAMAGYSGYGYGSSYTSADGGLTWIQTSLPSGSDIASSSDGTILAAAAAGGIYISTNSGATWTLTSTPMEEWSAIACSTNGAKLVAMAATYWPYQGGIFTSVNSGATWTQRPPTYTPAGFDFISVASSSDGNRLAAVGPDTGLYLSMNSGGNWTVSYAAGAGAVASSADGIHLVTAGTGDSGWAGGIYTMDLSIPQITNQPASQTLLAGQNVSVSGGVFCYATFYCQWQFNGTNLAGATYTNLTLTHTAPSNSGSYALLVTNAFGSALSSNAVLTVVPLMVATQPQSPSQPVLAGTSVTFSASAQSTVTLSFQWQFNGTNLPGATSSTLVLADVTPLNSGPYAVLFSNSFGSVLSSNAVLTVVPLIVATQPQSPSQPVLAGTNVTFSASAQSTAPLSFQWQFNGTDLPGATNSTLVLTNVTSLNSGTYAVLFGNSFGYVLGGDAVIATVLPAFVTTLPAVVNSATGAVLSGLVTPGPQGAAIWFEWGANANYGNFTGTILLPPGDYAVAASSPLTGLSKYLNYHYRLVARNAYGLADGADQQFAVAQTVLNTNDSGPGSLRQAIETASSAGAGGLIFGVTGAITLTNGELLITNNLTITGPGAANLVISGNYSSRVFEIGSNAFVNISGLTICGGQAASGGYFGGPGTPGGGIYNQGTLNLSYCALTDNSAGNGGPAGQTSWEGDVSYWNGGNGGNGGGIYNASNFQAIACTFSGNQAGAGGQAEFYPGGSQGVGGAIYNSGSLALVACTVSANLAGSGSGIFNAATNPSAELLDTLVASNGGLPDLAGPFTSLGYNLIGQTNGCTGFTNGVNADLAGTTAHPLDPMLGPLASNGGPSPTMALLHGSPALDAGDDALLGAPYNLTTDQRGFPRQAGGHVDIGAFEFQPIATPPALLTLHASAAGEFQFAFTNISGATFSVLNTTNLSATAGNWTVTGQALEVAPGQFQFTDPQTTNYLNRYDRVSSP
jgi:hypothetical protein